MPASQPAPTDSFDTGHAHAILRGFMDAGAELVQALVTQVRKDPDPHPFWGDKAPVEHPTEHIARCYDRITRSVRRSIALARHLDQPLRCRPGPARPSRPLAPASTAANDEQPEPGDTVERPDAPDWNPEQPDWNPDSNPDWTEDHHQDLSRPLGEVLAELEADLGLTADSRPATNPGAPSAPPEQGAAPGPASSRQPASDRPARPPTSPTRRPSG